MLIIGLDPGLGTTGWGIVAKSGSRLSHIANGQVKTDPKAPLAERLVTLDRELADVVLHHRPDSGAVEEVGSSITTRIDAQTRPGRGRRLARVARAGLPVAEYATGWSRKRGRHRRGDKEQVQASSRCCCPGSRAGRRSRDALAVAICHEHMARG